MTDDELTVEIAALRAEVKRLHQLLNDINAAWQADRQRGYQADGKPPRGDKGGDTIPDKEVA